MSQGAAAAALWDPGDPGDPGNPVALGRSRVLRPEAMEPRNGGKMDFAHTI